MSNYLVTFPRTGSFFLNFLINKNFSIDLVKTHDPVIPKDNDFVISTIRNPRDTLISYVTMLSHYRKDMDAIRIAHDLALSYIEYCKYFIDNSHIIFEYNSMSENPEEILRKFAEKYSKKLPDVIHTKFDRVDMVEKEHLGSSTTSHLYQDILALIDNIDLENAIMYYKKVLDSKNYLS